MRGFLGLLVTPVGGRRIIPLALERKAELLGVLTPKFEMRDKFIGKLSAASLHS